MIPDDLTIQPIDELIEVLEEPARTEAKAARDWAIVLTVFRRTLYDGGCSREEVHNLARDYQLFMLGPGKE